MKFKNRHHSYTGLEADAQTLAAYIGLLKVMRDYDLKRVISFHGRVQRAKALSNGYGFLLSNSGKKINN